MLFFFFPLQRFFVLDNGILKYSKSPIDVSNPDYNPQAQTGQASLTSARLGSESAETSAAAPTMMLSVFQDAGALCRKNTFHMTG